MAVLAFDTLKLAEKLAASGFTPEQAKGAASALSETMGEYLVTKEHFDRTIGDLRGGMDSHFERFETSADNRFEHVDHKFATLAASIDQRFAEFELRLLTRIGAMFGATIAILVALDKLL